MNLYHDSVFCRAYLSRILEVVRKHVPNSIIREAWAYKYSGKLMGRTVEFHIPSEKFYWYGQGCCKTYAKAKGWETYLQSKNIENPTLKGGYMKNPTKSFRRGDKVRILEFGRMGKLKKPSIGSVVGRSLGKDMYVVLIKGKSFPEEIHASWMSRNPGAAYHKEEMQRAERDARVFSSGSYSRGLFRGMSEAHGSSLHDSITRGLPNPKRNPINDKTTMTERIGNAIGAMGIISNSTICRINFVVKG